MENYYYKPIRLGNFLNNNYIAYESNGDRIKTMLVKAYLKEIKPYLRDTIIDLQKSDASKIQFLKIQFQKSYFFQTCW